MDSRDGSRLGSAVDDTSLDSVLNDGILNQSLAQNDVYHEMLSQVDLRRAADEEDLQVSRADSQKHRGISGFPELSEIFYPRPAAAPDFPPPADWG